jgi:hypothetical protein
MYVYIYIYIYIYDIGNLRVKGGSFVRAVVPVICEYVQELPYYLDDKPLIYIISNRNESPKSDHRKLEGRKRSYD